MGLKNNYDKFIFYHKGVPTELVKAKSRRDDPYGNNNENPYTKVP